jgi:Zn-finger nucleic acid-binding protein
MRLVQDKGYFVCDYCTSIYFPQESEDSIRNLGEPGTTNCPVCGILLVSALLDDIPVLQCGRCKGVLIPQAAFSFAVEVLRAKSSRPPIRPPAMDPKDLQRPLNCPVCSRKMDTHPYGGPGNIVIDNCYRCKVIWLDYGEMGKVIRAPGEDLGRWR